MRKQKTIQRICLVVFLMGSCLVMGCGDDIPMGRQPDKVRPKKRPAAKKLPKSGARQKQSMYAYSPVGKRDPFRSYLASEEENRPKRSSLRPTTDLEKYTLDQLRLTAIITGTSTPVAMVEDPRQKGHTVRIGTRIGNNGGRVSAIMRDRLIITETFRDAAGRKRKNRVQLKLPQEILTFGQ